MTRAFGDTFYWIALLNERDSAHARATEYSDRIDHVVTTEWVLVELANALGTTSRRESFVPTRAALLADAAVTVIGFESELYEAGIALYGNRPDKGWSLTDCISFEVMTRLGMTDALTGDRHFEQAGFVAMLK